MRNKLGIRLAAVPQSAKTAEKVRKILVLEIAKRKRSYAGKLKTFVLN